MSPTILSRLLHHRKWMKDKIWKRWLRRSSLGEERQTQAPTRIYHYDKNNVKFITLSNQYGEACREACGDVFTQEKVKSRSTKFAGVIPSENGSSLSIDRFAIFLKYEQILPLKVNRQLYQNLLIGISYDITSWREKESYIARSSVNQVCRFILNAWNFTKRISHLIILAER